METKFGKAISAEAENIHNVYGIDIIVAQILLLKGVTIYQDNIQQNRT